MICAGPTTDSGLVHGGAGPGKKVTVISVGGLVRPLLHDASQELIALWWPTTGSSSATRSAPS
jgi:D-arabinose 1-dehydrogenase-like Zn-dependent alcohol dehydrogenase